MSNNNDDALDSASTFEAKKRLVEELKVEWKQMWSERYNDKILAEGICIKDHSALKVERGVVLHANRDFKALNFQDVLKSYEVKSDPLPNAVDGGWGKFIQTKVRKPKANGVEAAVVSGKKVSKQTKKGGRGWLHTK
jgi:hypothetical protein